MKFDLRYPGQVFDEETGLSYNLHRYYDAATGRYVQADPIGLAGGWNRFGYVGGDPLNAIDPDGLTAVVALNRIAELGRGLYYRYGPAITEFIAGASGVNGAVASPAAISPLVAQIPAGVSRMAPIARGIAEGVESGAFCSATNANNYIYGYRAVSSAEAGDIAIYGFCPHPGGRSMDDKWFSESFKGANQLQNIFVLDKVIKAKIPLDVYGRSYKHPNIDNTGPGFCVQCVDLGLIPKP